MRDEVPSRAFWTRKCCLLPSKLVASPLPKEFSQRLDMLKYAQTITLFRIPFFEFSRHDKGRLPRPQRHPIVSPHEPILCRHIDSLHDLGI